MKVKGNQIKSRITLIKNEYSDDVLEKVLNSLSEEDQKVFRGIITNTTWFTFEAANRFDEAIIKVLGGNKDELYMKLGRASAKETLNGIHRVFLEPREPLAFIKKVNHIYRFYYNVGYREWESETATSGFINTMDAEMYSEGDCLTNVGYFTEGLEMCGAKNIKFVREKCREQGDKICQHHVSWTE